MENQVNEVCSMHESIENWAQNFCQKVRREEIMWGIRRAWWDNIKVDVKEILSECNYLAQDRSSARVLWIPQWVYWFYEGLHVTCHARNRPFMKKESVLLCLLQALHLIIHVTFDRMLVRTTWGPQSCWILYDVRYCGYVMKCSQNCIGGAGSTSRYAISRKHNQLPSTTGEQNRT